jgi:probable F420-dependent oxidoreductase
VQLGVITPVVTLLPRAHSAWEVDAGIDEVARVAEVADELGYHHLTCSEHVAIPTDVAEVRGARYWDPSATLGYLAARTTRIRLATHVLVLGYHHPLAIAKRYGTLDQVSGGRLILGVGVGSLEEEFDLLGAPFDDRGDRADDALRALRVSLSTATPAHDGPYYSFGDVVLDPHARQERVPLWVGGRTRRSLRRAVALADGWVPFGLGPDQLDAVLATVARPPGFDLVLWPERAVDPLGDPDGTRAVALRYRELGTTVLNLRFRSESLDHYLDQLAAMAELARALD